MEVTRSEPVLVHPAEGFAADEEYYYLSNLDQNIAVVMKTVHLYNAGGKQGGRDAARVLRDSLEKVLVDYYPLDGSLAVSAERKLVVRNDRRGVHFVEAEADGELRDLGDISVPGAGVLGELVFVFPEARNILEMPLLAVQVTKFKCGGFVLGITMNHCMADGLSAVQFLRSWADTARGLPLSTPPFLDRTVQRARQPPSVDFPHEEFTEMEDDTADPYDGQPSVYSSFTFDATKLDKLKRTAAEDGSDATACSTFVALTAFVWRARTAALGMHPDQKSKLLFAVDGRKRVVPPLPAGFWGNGIVFACCISTAGDLASKPLSVTVRAIQDAIRGTTDAFIRSAIDHIEVNRARPSLTATTLITAWTRLGFSSLDFGWGEAVQSGPAELPQKEVVLFLPHKSDGNSTAVILGLPVPAMEAFQDMVDVL